MSIVAFYRGLAPDSRGRKLDEILAWDDASLEDFHDFIQVLFPLPDPSMFNSRAPILDEETIAAFRGDETLRANLDRAFLRMLRFYGFRVELDGGIVPADDFGFQSRYWLVRYDHNHLRITRILRSMMLLGLEHRARAFVAALTEVQRERGGIINPETIYYWLDAVTPT